jgi:DNA-3-methyladenine glycosylase
MRKVLGPDFFNRPTLTVARDLLGKYLVRETKGEEIALMINECEAYDGPEDLAAHSRRGKTARTQALFGPAGHWYVYFVYGMHEMLNIVTKKDGAGILIRGAGHLDGPAKITKALKIDRSFYGKPAIKPSGLWLEDRGVIVNPRDIQKTPRIGVAYAGEWAHKPYRFVLKKQKGENRSPRP